MHIILYDGHCYLCNRVIKFIIRKDKHKKFSFATIKPEITDNNIRKGLQEEYDSVILLTDGNLYYKSEAVFRILNELGGIWKVLILFTAFPRKFTDWLYDIIAENRYKLFGRSDTCLVPEHEI